MERSPRTMSTQQADTRRPGAVRTALALAGVALAVYAGFIVLWMMGR